MLKWDLNKRFEKQVTVLTLGESKRTAGISVGDVADVGTLVATHDSNEYSRMNLDAGCKPHYAFFSFI